MDKKVLFLDIDGTLVDDQKRISEDNKNAIDLMSSKGHKVIINTGRPLFGVTGIIRELSLEREGCYVLAFNGGLLYEPLTKKILYKSTLSPELIQMVSSEAVKEKVHIHMFDEWDVLCESHWEDDDLRYYIGRLPGLKYKLIPDDDLSDVYSYKISGVDQSSKERLEEFGARLKCISDGRIDAFLSHSTLLEIVISGQNKGTGIDKVMEVLGIDKRHSIAVGDEENDIPMLEQAGIGVATKNATQKLKDVADMVTENDNNNSAVAEVIYKLILKDGN
ncbi:HAD family hydrolase [Oribacterium sp. FC2011]|uniref:HAD family hydrolase n=1 Tax=Oribacterium sp. FC2011 TaxID=1408311 RepID=UPI0004E2759A|nr:HAD family hydrolase [Oribacterium sp. FC2011]